jgi:flagellar biosynthesis protein FlhB
MTQAKTEEPSPHRLRLAREAGQVAFSPMLSAGVVLLAATGGLAWFGPELVILFEELWALSLASIPSGGSRGGALGPAAFLEAAAAMTSTRLAPFLALVVGVAGLGAFLQVGPLFSWKSMFGRALDSDRSPRLRPLFSVERLGDVGRSTLAMFALATAAIVFLVLHSRDIASLGTLHVDKAAVGIEALVMRAAFTLAVTMVVLGLGDLLVARWLYRRRLRMTRAERDRERRELEGDPRTREHRARAHQALLRGGATAARTATVVLTDGERAIALHYDPPTVPVPRVVAAERGAEAERLVAEARAADVPIAGFTEVDVTPELIESLMTLPAGAHVSPEHYDAVARVLLSTAGGATGAA